jgi:hypothetical protein
MLQRLRSFLGGVSAQVRVTSPCVSGDGQHEVRRQPRSRWPCNLAQRAKQSRDHRTPRDLSLRTDLANALLQPTPSLRLDVELPLLGLPFRLARSRGRAGLRWATARLAGLHGPRIPIAPQASPRRCSGSGHRHGEPPRFQRSARRSGLLSPDRAGSLVCTQVMPRPCHMSVDAHMEIATHSRLG